MSFFHVYVEGAADPSPEGVQQLATALSQKYGLAVTDVLTRLKAGRFRVKANVDQATADTYVKALTSIGARVKLDEARPSQPIAVQPGDERLLMRTPATPLPVVQPAAQTAPTTNAARPSTPALPPRAQTSPSTVPPRAQTSPSLPPSNRPATPQPFASGLSAAFTDEEPVQSNLGALANDSAFSLASLDGGEDKSPAASFEPPSPGLPASIGPAALPKAAAPTKPKDEPLDMFAPPDAESHEMNVDLATDEIEHRARKMSTPPAGVPVSPSPIPTTPVLRRTQPSIPAQGGVSFIAAEPPRARFAAGVLLSILIGFVPAHLFASMRESAKLDPIDQQVTTTQAGVATAEEYAQLDGFRAAQLAKKESERRTIMLMSLVIWGLAGAGVAYVWFRRVPWDRLGTTSA